MALSSSGGRSTGDKLQTLLLKILFGLNQIHLKLGSGIATIEAARNALGNLVKIGLKGGQALLGLRP